MQLGQGEPHSPEFLKQSERFAEIVLEYERQCQVRVGSTAVSQRCSLQHISGHLGLREWKEPDLIIGQRDPCYLARSAVSSLLKPSMDCLPCQERVGVDHKFLPACSHGLFC